MIFDYSVIIGKKVDQLFRESGLDQETFGLLIGQEQSTVSKIIKGKWKNPTLEKLVEIVTPFKKPLSWLLTEDITATPTRARIQAKIAEVPNDMLDPLAAIIDAYVNTARPTPDRGATPPVSKTSPR